MKIGVVHYRWSARGGAEQYIARLVDALLNRGHDVHIIAARRQNTVPKGASFIHIPTVRFPLWLRLPIFAFQVRRFLAQSVYDVSIGSGKVWGCDVIRPGGGCHRAYESRMSEARKAIFPNQATWFEPVKMLSPFNQVNRFVEDVMFQERPHVIAVSSLVREDILRFYPTLDPRIEVIPNGRDPGALDTPEITLAARRNIRYMLGIPENGFVMLLMATNPMLKGFRQILEVIRIMISERKEIDPYLIVVGARNSVTRDRLVHQYKLVSRVRSIPFVDNVDSWYRGSDVLTHLSLYDAFANVCLEAMSVGIPVLTSRFNGGAEVYTSGVNGLVIDHPWQYREIADMLMDAYLSHSLPEIGRQGYHRLFDFSQKINFERTIGLLESIAQGRKD